MTLPIWPPDELAAQLDLGAHEHLAVVGGGGKTTLVHHLSRALGGRRILTTTTKMGYDQDGGHPVLIDPSDAEIADIDGLTVVWRAIDEPVALGVEPESCDRWFGLVDHVVVEADGARRRPFKAPASYEPVVPSTSTLMVSVIGVDALGRVIAEGCHRPELVARLAGCSADQTLTPERAARVLLHPQGNRASLPAGARFVIVVTKVGTEQASTAAELGQALADLGTPQRGEAPGGPSVPFFAVANVHP